MLGINKDTLQVSPIQLRRYVWVVTGFWTVAIAIVLTWEILDERNQAVDIARSEATGAWKKEVAMIRWAASNGSVYVPVTEQTRPDPNLDYIPHRDISTPSGRKLTLISPPMIMSQVHALAHEQSGFHGHITSLQPIRRQDVPDAWEKQALQEFASGRGLVLVQDTTRRQPA
jgi:hypothetical protein